MKITEKQLKKMISEAIEGAMSAENGNVASYLENLLNSLNGVMQILNDWIFESAEYDPKLADISEELKMYPAYEAIGGLIERIKGYLRGGVNETE